MGCSTFDLVFGKSWIQGIVEVPQLFTESSHLKLAIGHDGQLLVSISCT
jgi:hypothetical protein